MHCNGALADDLRWEAALGEIDVGFSSGGECRARLRAAYTGGLAIFRFEAGLAVGSCQYRVRSGVAIVAQELGSRDEGDLCVRELRFETVEDGDAVGRSACIVAE